MFRNRHGRPILPGRARWSHETPDSVNQTTQSTQTEATAIDRNAVGVKRELTPPRAPPSSHRGRRSFQNPGVSSTRPGRWMKTPLPPESGERIRQKTRRRLRYIYVHVFRLPASFLRRGNYQPPFTFLDLIRSNLLHGRRFSIPDFASLF